MTAIAAHKSRGFWASANIDRAVKIWDQKRNVIRYIILDTEKFISMKILRPYALLTIVETYSLDSRII